MRRLTQNLETLECFDLSLLNPSEVSLRVLLLPRFLIGDSLNFRV